MSLHTRLQRRKSNGIYYCHVVVPAKLQHIIGKGKIYTSLKTSDPIVAKERVKIESYALLMNGDNAQMVITDPPYNVKISGHVTGNGAVQHDEFAMAAGEMSLGEFTDFLSTAFALVNEYSKTLELTNLNHLLE